MNFLSSASILKPMSKRPRSELANLPKSGT